MVVKNCFLSIAGVLFNFKIQHLVCIILLILLVYYLFENQWLFIVSEWVFNGFKKKEIRDGKLKKKLSKIEHTISKIMKKFK